MNLIYDDITLLNNLTLTDWFTGGKWVLFDAVDLPPGEGLEFPAGFIIRESIDFVWHERRVPGIVMVDTQEILLVPSQLEDTEWQLSLNMFAEFRLKIYVK